ncbi:PD-(D/E)XK motif protein [Xanthomonas campestris]|uniref:PD-(D/E)XK motif protein n=1 Tax=Xanthomonas campestris TaxID=339 RepID=UPI0025A1B417|nr:PD-(D/E)XK motif protein [Xanthomonas campestris]MDM7585980.1 PD-(D/E)XK motif protein [Xanthomonas campestris]MDM7593236.1 PD-(D/E)XK motif protein [Xanthomonas campestris]MEA9865212.1 PD-(D/E)XK motif protein [Xanthomonas campestris pv. raphani]
MTSYEAVLDQISAIPAGAIGDDRAITWLTDAKVVGLARNSRGHLELFLAGDQLKPRTSIVKSAIHHHSWHRDTLPPLRANRILLPALGHFDQVGAFIAAELLRERADVNLERAFAVTEPLIELAIKRLEISENAILGLLGELLLLDAVCRRADDLNAGQVIQAWDGWRRSARDFTWEGTGVEIKTTTRATSSHAIHGVHQIEPAPVTDNTLGEARLLLVSIGLSQTDPNVPALSIPSLVESIVERLTATGASGLVDEFLMRVAVYGSESGIGYEHPRMANEAPFTTSFTVTFIRGYDMADPAITGSG